MKYQVLFRSNFNAFVNSSLLLLSFMTKSYVRLSNVILKLHYSSILKAFFTYSLNLLDLRPLVMFFNLANATI